MIDKPLVWKDGPLEAYIMISAVSGRIDHWPTIPQPVVDLLKAQKYPSQLLVNTPKPSFLLWDRIYTKALSVEEGVWLVRSLANVFYNETQASLEKSGAGHLVSQAFIWTITSHPAYQVRNVAFEELSQLASQQPAKLAVFSKEAIKQWLLDIENNTKESTALTSVNADNYKPELAGYRLASVLNAITSFKEDESEAIKIHELVELIVLAHHQYLASPSNKYNWITLVQRAGVNPGKIVEERMPAILSILKKSLLAPKEVKKKEAYVYLGVCVCEILNSFFFFASF
jgi:hypothetical protein